VVSILWLRNCFQNKIQKIYKWSRAYR